MNSASAGSRSSGNSYDFSGMSFNIQGGNVNEKQLAKIVVGEMKGMIRRKELSL